MSELQTVYVITNPAMPGLVKIGLTTRGDVEIRIRELYGTGVPVPFDIAYAAVVENAQSVEDALHRAFDPDRVNPKREFFKIDAERVIPILRLLERSDITDEIQRSILQDSDQTDIFASDKLKKRRPVMNFREMGIPIDGTAKLIFSDTPDNEQPKEAIICGERLVKSGDGNEEMFLSKLTQQILGDSRPIQPSLYWLYEGKKLKDIYEETYPFEGNE